MRTTAHFGAIAAALICSTGLAGCQHLEYHFGPLGVVEAEQAGRAPAPRRATARHVARPALVPAGAKLRHFCGQRHIQFQTGALKESASEKARNNELCRQVYTG